MNKSGLDVAIPPPKRKKKKKLRNQHLYYKPEYMKMDSYVIDLN